MVGLTFAGRGNSSAPTINYQGVTDESGNHVSDSALKLDKENNGYKGVQLNGDLTEGNSINLEEHQAKLEKSLEEELLKNENYDRANLAKDIPRLINEYTEAYSRGLGASDVYGLKGNFSEISDDSPEMVKNIISYIDLDSIQFDSNGKPYFDSNQRVEGRPPIKIIQTPNEFYYMAPDTSTGVGTGDMKLYITKFDSGTKSWSKAEIGTIPDKTLNPQDGSTRDQVIFNQIPSWANYDSIKNFNPNPTKYVDGGKPIDDRPWKHK